MIRRRGFRFNRASAWVSLLVFLASAGCGMVNNGSIRKTSTSSGRKAQTTPTSAGDEAGSSGAAGASGKPRGAGSGSNPIFDLPTTTTFPNVVPISHPLPDPPPDPDPVDNTDYSGAVPNVSGILRTLDQQNPGMLQNRCDEFLKLAVQTIRASDPNWGFCNKPQKNKVPADILMYRSGFIVDFAVASCGPGARIGWSVMPPGSECTWGATADFPIPTQ